MRYMFWVLDMLVYARYSLKLIIFSMWDALRTWLTFDFMFCSQKNYIQYNDVWQYIQYYLKYIFKPWLLSPINLTLLPFIRTFIHLEGWITLKPCHTHTRMQTVLAQIIRHWYSILNTLISCFDRLHRIKVLWWTYFRNIHKCLHCSY